MSAVAAEAGIYRECAEVEETCPELKHATAALNSAVPALRASITQQQHLGLFPVQVETEDRVVRQSYKQSGKIATATITKPGMYGKPVEVTVSAPRESQLVEVTNKVVVGRSDRTLLLRGKPDQLQDMKLKRQTSRSKRILTERREEPAVIEVSLEEELDLDLD